MRLPLSAKALSLLAGLIIGSAPIYWFASGYVLEIKIIKIIFITAFFFLTIASTPNYRARGLLRPMVVPKSFGLIEFAIFGCAIFPSLLLSKDYGQALAFAGNVIFAFIFVLLAYHYHSIIAYWNVRFGSRYFSLGLLFLIPFCLLVVTNAAFSWPSFVNPFGDYHDFALGEVPLSYTGFGGSRTGWGAGVAVVFPLIAFSTYLSFRSKALIALVALIVFFSVAIPAGRGALIAILLSTAIALSIIVRNKLGYWTLFVGVASAIAIVAVGNLESLRIDTAGGVDADELVTGRISSYLLGVDLIFANPFIGVGAGAVDLTAYGSNAVEIHNTFLHIAAQFGMLSGALVFAFYVNILWTGYRLAVSDARYAPHFASLLAGFIICFSEPNVVFGTMFNMLPLWFSVATILYGKAPLRIATR